MVKGIWDDRHDGLSCGKEKIPLIERGVTEKLGFIFQLNLLKAECSYNGAV